MAEKTLGQKLVLPSILAVSLAAIGGVVYKFWNSTKTILEPAKVGIVEPGTAERASGDSPTPTVIDLSEPAPVETKTTEAQPVVTLEEFRRMGDLRFYQRQLDKVNVRLAGDLDDLEIFEMKLELLKYWDKYGEEYRKKDMEISTKSLDMIGSKGPIGETRRNKEIERGKGLTIEEVQAHSDRVRAVIDANVNLAQSKIPVDQKNRTVIEQILRYNRDDRFSDLQFIVDSMLARIEERGELQKEIDALSSPSAQGAEVKVEGAPKQPVKQK